MKGAAQKKKIELLRLSIEDWKRQHRIANKYKNKKNEQWKFVRHSTLTCALCGGYYSCIGCPIQKKTGLDFCSGTPFVKWNKYGAGKITEAWLKRHQTMIDWMEKLLSELVNEKIIMSR